MCDIVVTKFTFAVSSPDEFLWKISDNISKTVQDNLIVSIKFK